MKENLFILKAACLFHDPPNKAWFLRERRNHREEARRIASGVLENTCLKDAIVQMERKAKPADMLASSVDRWLLSKLAGEEYHAFPVNEIKFKNIFNPKFSQEVSHGSPSTDKFIETLNEVIKPIRDVRLAYHVLYACYEPLWVQLGLPVSPADTRAPSHSVFDHNYATAAVMNWLLGSGDPKGILLHIDLGGPQRFISSSRKLSDLWISSYLASALAWSIFWLFIKPLGPDVMVLPTCRENPFYYHSLLAELMLDGVNEVAVKTIKKISKEFAGYDPDKDKIPRYAVVPVTATFMLPELELLKEIDDFREIDITEKLKGLEDFVRKKYQAIWKSVYDEVVEKCKDLQAELNGLATEAARLLNECRRFGFDTTPPLPLRVIALQTSTLYTLGLNKEEHYSLYHYMFKLLSSEVSGRLYKFRPEEDLRLFDMTSQPIETWPRKATRGFEYCSVCGYLPAILIFSSKEDEHRRSLEKIGLEAIFSPGERLCPYCLIKRFLALSEILKPVMDRLLGEVSGEKPARRFIPVCDLALMPFKRSLIEKAQRIDASPQVAEKFSKLMDTVWKRMQELGMDIKSSNIFRREEPILVGEDKLLKVIEGMRTQDLKMNLKSVLFLNTEMAVMGEHRIRSIWLDLIRNINKYEDVKNYNGPIKYPNAYYAIIRCDGDNLGLMIQGRIKEGFRVPVEDYLCGMLEGPAREVIEAIVNNDLELARRICEDNGVSDAASRVYEIARFINKLKSRYEVIISPSYHSALGRALMANAIRDVKIIEECDGLTIYAGGDDLLALTPVENSLQAVQQLRKGFSFPSEKYRGFDIRGSYLIPSLATASRSFSVYLTHYMFPLYSALGRSAELLDEMAKKSTWIVDSERRNKDALVITYSPRGGERRSLLPLSDIKSSDPDQNLAKSLKYIEELLAQIEKRGDGFSSSLIYDLYDNLKVIKPLISSKNTDLLERLLKRIFERNCEVHDRQKREEMASIWAQKLIEDYDVGYNISGAKVDKDALPTFEQFILALRLYRSSLRGVE